MEMMSKGLPTPVLPMKTNELCWTAARKLGVATQRKRALRVPNLGAFGFMIVRHAVDGQATDERVQESLADKPDLQTPNNQVAVSKQITRDNKRQPFVVPVLVYEPHCSTSVEHPPGRSTSANTR